MSFTSSVGNAVFSTSTIGGAIIFGATSGSGTSLISGITSGFFTPFFGLVEESIVLKSILSNTFKASSSGATILVNPSFIFTGSSVTFIGSGIISTFSFSAFASCGICATSGAGMLGSTTGITLASTMVASDITVVVAFGLSSFFLKERSCSSLFFFGSVDTALISSTLSAFSLAVLSPWYSLCNTRYISSVSLEVGLSSLLPFKFFDTRNSIKVLAPMLNSLAAAISLGVFNSDIRFFCCTLG